MRERARVLPVAPGEGAVEMAARTLVSSFEALLAEAVGCLRGGKLDEAERMIARALAVRPEHPQALLIAAAIAARRGQRPRAEELCRLVLAHDPGEVEALYLLGELRCDAGAHAEAADCLMRGFRLEFSLPEFEDPIEFWKFLVDGIEGEAPIEYLIRRARELKLLGTALEASGMLLAHDAAMRARLAQVNLFRWSDNEASLRLELLLGLAGFSIRSAPEWNGLLFDSVLIAWSNRALETDRFDLALLLETAFLREYVRQTEAEEHFRRCVARWLEPMRAAGRRFGHSLPPLPKYGPQLPPGAVFLLHNLSGLAHVRLLVDFLEGHAELDKPLLRPLLACVSKADNSAAREMEQRLRRIGVQVVELPAATGSVLGIAGIRRLREELAARQIDAVVWISVVQAMPFAFAARVAPVQIWWAMKYHGVEFPEIDGYLTAGSLSGGTRQIGGRVWRAGPVAARDWYVPELAEQAARIRANYTAHQILFGCFGREEKLHSPTFLQAVADILRRVPESGFLWTGRHRHPAIQSFFDRAGVADRCHYIGWVDTRLYAQVIDVFLDSFPFPCGYTLYEALAAGKPALLYASAEAAETGARSLIEPLLRGETASEEDSVAARAIFIGPDGESVYLCAQNPAEYVAMAVRLASDGDWRCRAGEAGRRFVAHFMSDRKRLGRIYAEHIVAIVREATAHPRSGLDVAGHGDH